MEDLWDYKQSHALKHPNKDVNTCMNGLQDSSLLKIAVSKKEKK